MSAALPAIKPAEESALRAQQEQQRFDALNPEVSVWVSASAGSGKTTLLTERVLRLLLQGLTEGRRRLPGILCLTYTKAAAAEMHNRIHAHLSQWASASEEDLHGQLYKLYGVAVEKEVMRHARRLFALLLEKPETVRIMTMHAFCLMLLHRFPLESGLAPHFTQLEGKDEKDLQTAVMDGFLARLRGDTGLQDAWRIFAASQGVSRTHDMLAEVFRNSREWKKCFTLYPDEDFFRAKLLEVLQLESGEQEEKYLARHFAAPYFDEERIRAAAAILGGGSKNETKVAEKITGWLQDPLQRVERYQAYAAAFLTTEGEIRNQFVFGATAKAHPALESEMQAEAQRVLGIVNTVQALRFYHQQCAYYRLTRALWLQYENTKEAHACFTFDDLILKTCAVLSKPGIAPWILYKLDGGLDHLLVDEAQDTSPDQWEVVFRMLEDFLSGKGARDDFKRTLFVVGDEKQSIYSFQGADRYYYLQVKERLFRQMKAAQRDMIDVERKQSFRSAPELLRFVDSVFAPEAVRKGVTHEALQHFAAQKTAKGLVELWPFLPAQEKKMPEPWTVPLQREDSPSAGVQLAKKIAETVALWLREGWQVGARDVNARPIKPEDIIILLQKRDPLLAPIIRALKEKNVPVSGIDRMKLNEQGAVQDALALCRFLLLPQDDLTLAEVLRGPLIRMTEEALFALAHGRKGGLWESLQLRAETDAECKVIADYLRRFLNRADRDSPFVLLSNLLFSAAPAHPRSGQAAIVECLGSDAVDPLEQLLSAARDYETLYPLSLQGFVLAVAGDDTDIKREQAKAGGEVRIMTTHGAKGLEAPIVIVPDLLHPVAVQWNRVLHYTHANGMIFAATPGCGDVPLIDAIKQRMEEQQEEENRRLLYVALTRAENVLLLCGAQKSVKQAYTPWWDHCVTAMQELCQEKIGETPLRFGNPSALSRGDTGAAGPSPAAQLPEWLHEKVPQEREPAIYNPSQRLPSQEDASEKMAAPMAGSVSGYHRGTLLHRLLQLLPGLPPAQQEEAAHRFLLRELPGDEKAVAADVKEVLAVLHHPDFAPIFSAAAESEVPIIGTLGGRKFSGQIDRMVVGEKEILLVDFKTNRPPPLRVEDVDIAYLVQMACYAKLLRAAYPQKTVRAGLLWTHHLRLMELDSEALKLGEAELERRPRGA